MRLLLPVALLSLAATNTQAQPQNQYSKFDVRHWGVVLKHVDMEKVVVKEDVLYFKDEKASLHFDLYMPPAYQTKQLLPAVIFLNGIGEQAGQPAVKSWEIYRSWPRLMAAEGFIGIAMESDGNRVQESLHALFDYLDKEGKRYGIDATRLGVYAASANTNQSGQYLMKSTAYKGIKAAVLYYGNAPAAPFRKDLPVLFFIAEGDVRGNAYQAIWTDVVKNKAPWTITMGSDLPHAFDALTNNELARTAIKATISFWKNHLETEPASSSQPFSPEREILEMQYWQRPAKQAELMGNWLKANPGIKDDIFFQQYGRALFNSGELEQAEKILKECISHGADNNFLLLNLAAVSFALNKPAEAENYLAALGKKETIRSFHYLNIANSLYQFKKYGHAAYCCEKAIALEPRAVDYYNLGCYYSLDGNKEKAFDALQKAAAAGYNTKADYESDTDLEPLRPDPRWKILLEKLQ